MYASIVVCSQTSIILVGRRPAVLSVCVGFGLFVCFLFFVCFFALKNTAFWHNNNSQLSIIFRQMSCTFNTGAALMTMERPGPGCSKLTTSLVNVSLKFQKLISQICQYFLLKKCEAFAVQKLLSFCQQKISVFLVIKW